MFVYTLKRDRDNRQREQEIRPTGYREYYVKTTGINWDKDGIGQRRFSDNSEDLRVCH